MQPIGTELITVYGHKTIYLTDERMLPAGAEQTVHFPVISVPAMLKRAFGRMVEWTPLEPAAMSCFGKIRADVHPMLSEAEKWFGELKRAMQQENISVPDAMYACMRRFIEVATRKVRGGFLSAADIAVCHWLVPVLALHKYDAEKILGALAGLPRTLEQLGVK